MEKACIWSGYCRGCEVFLDLNLSPMIMDVGNWPYLKGNCYTSMFSLPCLREAAEDFVLLGGLVFMPACFAGLMNIVHQRLVSFLLTWTFPKSLHR